MSTNTPKEPPSVVLRLAGPTDDSELRRLAELDSTTVPAGTMLLAEVDGVPRAAYSPVERRAIADPFHPTADLVELLELHGDRPSDDRQGADRTRAATSGNQLAGRRAPWPA